MNICTIIQARTTSTRFKNKIFENFEDKKVIEYVIKECLISSSNKTILVVPKNQLSEFKWLKQKYKSIELFGGDEHNVLKRYYDASLKHDAEIIVRITSDCPLINHLMIDDAINFFLINNDYDYCINTSLETSYKDKENNNITYKSNTYLSDGFDVEVFSIDALKLAHRNAILKSEKEHTTIWMKENLKCGIVKNMAQIIKGKFSLDEKKDVETIENFLTLKEKGFIKIGQK